MECSEQLIQWNNLMGRVPGMLSMARCKPEDLFESCRAARLSSTLQRMPKNFLGSTCREGIPMYPRTPNRRGNERWVGETGGSPV